MVGENDLDNILFSVGYTCRGSKYYMIKQLYIENHLDRFVSATKMMTYFEAIETVFPEVIECLDFRDISRLKILLKMTKDGYDYQWSRI